MKNRIFAIVCLVFGLVFNVQAATSGFWSLKEIKLKDTGNSSDGIFTYTVAVSANSAKLKLQFRDASPTDITTSWTSPPSKIDPAISSKVELSLTATLNSMWTENAYGYVAARIDIPGLEYSYTGGSIELTDQNGKHGHYVDSGTRTFTVKVAANMPSGSNNPFTSIYVKSSGAGSAEVEFAYEWIPDEPATPSASTLHKHHKSPSARVCRSIQ